MGDAPAVPVLKTLVGIGGRCAGVTLDQGDPMAMARGE
jgi:hypothetical protein